MDCQIEHSLGDFFIRNITEIIRFFANLVGIADGAGMPLPRGSASTIPPSFLIAAWTPKARRPVSPWGAM